MIPRDTLGQQQKRTMIIPIRCFTCGKVLADKYNYYVAEVKKLEQDQEKTKPQEQHFDAIRTGPILDRLGLTRYCCRRHMLGTVDMMEII